MTTPDVPPPSKVDTHSGGIVNVSWVQPGASVQCAWRKVDGLKAKWLAATIVSLNVDGTVNARFTSSGMFCDEVGRGDLRRVTESEAQGGTNLLIEFDDNTTEAAAAAEAVTAGNVTSTQDGRLSVEASNLEEIPAIVPNESDSPNQQRECITHWETAAHSRWKADVNAKYREVRASLLRITCITDQTARIITWTDVLSSSVVHL